MLLKKVETEFSKYKDDAKLFADGVVGARAGLMVVVPVVPVVSVVLVPVVVGGGGGSAGG